MKFVILILLALIVVSPSILAMDSPSPGPEFGQHISTMTPDCPKMHGDMFGKMVSREWPVALDVSALWTPLVTSDCCGYGPDEVIEQGLNLRDTFIKESKLEPQRKAQKKEAVQGKK